jgi:ABC-type oligopeptide transport system ATPase subunit
MNKYILEIKNLCKYFPINKKMSKKAVDDVSLCIEKGEIFGIIGESGCGKTTLVRTLKGLYQKDAGQIIYDGVDIDTLDKKETSNINLKMQMVFQDPISSLNPRMNVLSIVTEGLVVKGARNKDYLIEQAGKYLELVGLSKEYIYRYPHEFSGGQRQRIGLARALIMKPDLLILDEPISSLDVSMQAQILNLLKKLKKEMNLTMIFISHNLLIASQFSDHVAVMYDGKIVELGASKEIFENSQHPYTNNLLNSVAYADPNKERNKQEVDIVNEFSTSGELVAISKEHYVRKEK